MNYSSGQRIPNRYSSQSSEGVGGCLNPGHGASRRPMYKREEELSPTCTMPITMHHSHFTSNTIDGGSFHEPSGQRNDVVKIVCISDTHNGHSAPHFDHQIRQIKGDILIHAGDFSNHGSPAEVEKVLSWLKSLNNFEYKILIAGNMDGIDLDDAQYDSETRRRQFSHTGSGIIYLENESCNVRGINIYGCPYTPKFCGGFQYERHSRNTRELWNMIPHNCDILVSHGPPQDIFDQTSRGTI
ncbi:unnamed protein product [Rotaria socialis]|uniref:Calcineurin-like phosphoesterase domain-containing protein n=1 Tax=Rotaria socialis TaxID=392032 RepID=A0A818MY39_9BILA|nr:unnamed protein product [Rotaria socialis]CAF4682198.1 unnamed protein product [Rotaria socialis]